MEIRGAWYIPILVLEADEQGKNCLDSVYPIRSVETS